MLDLFYGGLIMTSKWNLVDWLYKKLKKFKKFTKSKKFKKSKMTLKQHENQLKNFNNKIQAIKYWMLRTEELYFSQNKLDHVDMFFS